MENKALKKNKNQKEWNIKGSQISVSVRLAWFTEGVPAQPELLHGETPS